MSDSINNSLLTAEAERQSSQRVSSPAEAIDLDLLFADDGKEEYSACDISDLISFYLPYTEDARRSNQASTFQTETPIDDDLKSVLQELDQRTDIFAPSTSATHNPQTALLLDDGKEEYSACDISDLITFHLPFDLPYTEDARVPNQASTFPTDTPPDDALTSLLQALDQWTDNKELFAPPTSITHNPQTALLEDVSTCSGTTKGRISMMVESLFSDTSADVLSPPAALSTVAALPTAVHSLFPDTPTDVLSPPAAKRQRHRTDPGDARVCESAGSKKQKRTLPMKQKDFVQLPRGPLDIDVHASYVALITASEGQYNDPDDQGLLMRARQLLTTIGIQARTMTWEDFCKFKIPHLSSHLRLKYMPSVKTTHDPYVGYDFTAFDRLCCLSCTASIANTLCKSCWVIGRCATCFDMYGCHSCASDQYPAKVTFKRPSFKGAPDHLMETKRMSSMDASMFLISIFNRAAKG